MSIGSEISDLHCSTTPTLAAVGAADNEVATCQRPTTVLIVDDEEPIRRLVDRILTHAGYVTATASNGADALRIAGTLMSLDMLVTDMMMPGMDGGELARRLREDRGELKVLYVTGWSDRASDVKRAACPGEAFLEKPFSPQGLRAAVAALAAKVDSFAAAS